MPNEDVSPSASLRKESFFFSVREKNAGFPRKERRTKETLAENTKKGSPEIPLANDTISHPALLALWHTEKRFSV